MSAGGWRAAAAAASRARARAHAPALSRSALGRSTSWLVMNSRSMSRKSSTRSSFICRSLQRVEGTTLGSLPPARPWPPFFFLRLMRVRGLGSNFFFSPCAKQGSGGGQGGGNS